MYVDSEMRCLGRLNTKTRPDKRSFRRVLSALMCLKCGLASHARIRTGVHVRVPPISAQVSTRQPILTLSACDAATDAVVWFKPQSCRSGKNPKREN